MVRIADFATLSIEELRQAAQTLSDAFAGTRSALAQLHAANAEVQSFRDDPERFAVAAFDGPAVIAWIGWIAAYSHAWELHPLVVAPARQRQGIGTFLVGELERRARAAGVLTLILGADDESGGTNLYGVDLFPDVLHHARTTQQTTRHPIAFYRRLGFEVVGVLPDVNGFGRPDILMAKRL
jgi:aminoglycoside 6'-N-acetyltransferase I